MKAVGIDIGTTTISATVIDASDLRVIEKYTISNGTFVQPAPSWERIQDIHQIAAKSQALLEGILAAHPDIRAIGLTGQMHGIVYVDKAGTAVSPLFTWQDGRGNLPCFDGKSLCSMLEEEHHVKAATGYGMVTHLYHVKKGIVPEGAWSFCTAADYLGMALTGRSKPLLHISQAASLGLYDTQNHRFLLETIQAAGIDPAMLPDVTGEIIPLGTYQGIPVSVSLGDNQASYIGSVTDGANTVLVNVGTGAQISMLSDKYYEAPGIEARPLTRQYWLLVGSSLCGGAAYALLERFFREYAVAAGAPDVPQYDTMGRLLEQDPQAALNVTTTFAGTREDPAQRGSITEIDTTNFHPAGLIRGVLNGMAEELFQMYQTAQSVTGKAAKKVVASGNGVRRNVELQQILSRQFGMPLTVENNEEEAAYGAAISGLAGTGSLSLEGRLGMAAKKETLYGNPKI